MLVVAAGARPGLPPPHRPRPPATTCWPTSATCSRIKLSSKHPNTHALSLPRHKAILTALLNRDALGARQATLVQLEETREDLSMILHSGIDPL